MAVPYTFGTATAAIPLSQLDSNFATAITIGNTAVQLGNTVTTLNNMTLANVTISSGTVTITNVAVTTANVSGTANISTLVVVGNETVGGNTTITGNITAANANVTTNLVLSGGTANGVAYLNTSKVLTTGSALVFDGTNLGVGVTPSAWASTFKAIQIGAYGVGWNTHGSLPIGYLNANCYYNGSNWIYTTSNPATQFVTQGQSGSFQWNTAASGTAGNAITFTQAMTLDASGNLIVAGTGAGLINNNSQQITASGYLISNHVNGTSSGSVYVYFGYNGSSIGSITQNGTTGVLYNLISDYRLKNDQQALTGAKDFIMALKPKKWQWRDGSGEGVGFVAHEFMEVAKHSGNGEKDAIDSDGKPVYQSIQPSSSEVMANLVAFIQELKTEIDSLKSQLNGA